MSIVEVRLTGFRVSGGDEVALPRSGVTCIVGGNNVGKSQLLREIAARAIDVNQASSLVNRSDDH